MLEGQKVDIADVLKVRDEQRRDRRASIRSYIVALTNGDVTSLPRASQAISSFFEWRSTLSRVGKLSEINATAQQWFAAWWVQNGDSLREDVNDDAILIRALRKLLPGYVGPSVTLYRGDSAMNRKRRTYGPSWSADLATADGFARGRWRNFEGGSVVLEAKVQPDAILFAPALNGDELGEQEYIVDRRRLSGVTVIARYPALPVSDWGDVLGDTGPGRG